MNALEVLRTIIERHRLDAATFTLVSHPADAGWRLPAAHPVWHGTPITGDRLRQLELSGIGAYRAAGDHVVSISSRLTTDRGDRHLALMDLHLDEHVPARLLEHLAQVLGGGHRYWLLRSGRRHHLYCDRLFDDEGWSRWNLRSLSPPVVADPRYVDSSQSSRCNLLRLDAGASPHRSAPRTFDATDRGSPVMAAAVLLALERHPPRVDRGGEPIFDHLGEVAATAMRMGSDWRSQDEIGSPEELYACGYLHACLDETGCDYEDVLGAAGPNVAEWVAEVSRDKRLPGPEGQVAYEARLARAGRPARAVKLADLLSDLRALVGPGGGTWTAARVHEHERQLDAIRDGLDACPAFREARAILGQWHRRPT